jgi:hypothetical protein
MKAKEFFFENSNGKIPHLPLVTIFQLVFTVMTKMAPNSLK